MSGTRITPYRCILVLIFLVVSSLFSITSADSANARPTGVFPPDQGPATPGEPRLRLRAGAVDPLAGALPQVNGIEAAGRDPYAPALHLVQFPGPIQDEWLKSLTEAGLTIVTYVPDYAYLVWGSPGAVARLALAAPLRWRGDYQPDYALHPDLAPLVGRSAGPSGEKPVESLAVYVQVVDQPETAGVTAQILEEAQAVIRPPVSTLAYRNLVVEMTVDGLAWLAVQPGVVNVAPYYDYQLLDEVQGQIMAGNLNELGTGPGGPGYLAWLEDLGFSGRPEDYAIVDITDDGIDDGDGTPLHPDFYTEGNPALLDRLIYNYNWTADVLANGLAGHGNLNASVVGGFNNQTGSVYRDPNGYQRGLGINPFGRLAGSKVFRNTGAWGISGNIGALISNSYSLGARISTNSWGASTFGDYNPDDQTYDLRVRDALEGQTGNQEMVVLFSAGNDGSGGNTIGSPGNAKNVITVGASESYRPEWESLSNNYCPDTPEDTNSLQDVADFSSRGPTDDGRTKPDLVAPGTMILGAASQAPGYDGSGVCVRNYPTGQVLYAASSGTSHSTPAVAGAASLLDYYYRTNLSAGKAPSPAMVKAYLVNSTRYLTGQDANDSLPSPDQGFGLVDLGRAFDDTPRFLLDQEVTLGESGEVYEMAGQVFDPGQPLRVTLAWTDAPGATVGAAYVNDLNLELVIDGETYLGNVFSGAFSRADGTADFRNNVESIYLPAGTSGTFSVRVRAANLAGDGLPGNIDLSDQDFALVVYNARISVGELTGVVREQPANAGLAGAMIQAQSASGRKVQTTVDADGAYTLTLWAGTYTLQAWKYGYSMQTVSGRTIADGGAEVQDFDLTPVLDYTFRSCVTDAATGQGLAATVSILSPFGDLLTTVNTTISQRCFTLNLPAGEYRVQVSSRLHYPVEADLNLIQNVRQDFPLEASTTDGVVYGQVSDQVTGLPLPGAGLTFQPGNLQAFSGSGGEYEVQMTAGVYTMTVTASLYESVVTQVEVLQSNLVESSYALAAPMMVLNRPAEFQYALDPGDVISLTIHIENHGDAPMRFAAYERLEGRMAGGTFQDGGYSVQDSLNTSEVRYDWIDAGEGGLSLPLNDDGEANVDLPFGFSFFGQVYDALRIGNNGAAVFDTSYGDIAFMNPDLSLLHTPFIAPFWDDLDDERGYVMMRTLGAAPDRQFVIEWNNRPHYNNRGEATFETILYEATGNIKFQYQDVFFEDPLLDRGMEATIGVRGAGSAFLQLSYNRPTRSNLSAVCFQAPGSPPCDRLDLPWLAVSPSEGTLDVGEGLNLTVRVDASRAGGLGYFPGGVRLFTSDPHSQPYVDIPAGLLLMQNPMHLPLILR